MFGGLIGMIGDQSRLLDCINYGYSSGAGIYGGKGTNNAEITDCEDR